jgi:hypothetical protein
MLRDSTAFLAAYQNDRLAPKYREPFEALIRQFALDRDGYKSSREGEPTIKMRKAYQRLLQKGHWTADTTIKAMHRDVLRELGVEDPIRGYTYETFRKIVTTDK